MRPRTRNDADNEWVANDDIPGGFVYKGFKFSQMPQMYVIGDDAVYNQISPDLEIKVRPLLNLDTEYPESEFYKGSNLQKWIRKVNRVTLNRQIFPIYTSMEGMTTDVHDLTEQQMKGITFQVVPQFYWRYEQTYNRFMIHRVGKLSSPTSDFYMYDMLGNVWEWVRDDWSGSVKQSLDGKDNPIVGSSGTSFTGDAQTKVIKGGAFDQFCRKTISPSREGLAYNQCQSQFGTQANVGFRPSLTYTVEPSSITMQGSGEPVDLFFLFDASASQDNDIQQMIDKANEIVRFFAGTEENRDQCHVGSALYLGPTFRLMCSKQVHQHKQMIWWSSNYEAQEDWTTKKKGEYRHVEKWLYLDQEKRKADNQLWNKNGGHGYGGGGEYSDLEFRKGPSAY